MGDGSASNRQLFRRCVGGVVGVLVATVVASDVVVAHVGALSDSAGSTTVPPWLTFLTGGGIVAGSFLFTALLTDHEAIRMVNNAALPIPVPDRVQAFLTPIVQAFSVGVLLVVVGAGLVGIPEPTANFAILFVWAGWWAGYTATVYLVGNTWPVLNPWRAMTDLLPRTGVWSYPDWLGDWPSVGGLLVLVYLEVVTPVASDPELLASLIVVYTVISVLGVVAVGQAAWFGRVDPITRVFRMYGALAPFQRTASGIGVRLPTTALTDADTPPAGATRFVITLLWVTTFDGLVSTPAWATVVEPIVEAGVPALVVYGVGMVGGFGVFVWVYGVAAGRARKAAESYITVGEIGAWLVPALLPIAAAYHLAHFLGYFVSLAPALVAAAGAPFAGPASVPLAVLPGWWPVLQLGIVLLGHLLAVWVAHAVALELFPGRLRAIRSQAPFVIAMILYTVTSMWIIVQPSSAPPYV